MVGRRDYASQECSLARALEIVGERWTLLVLRDAFYGVERFGDFVTHLGIPRAVLSDRLASLVRDGVLERVGDGRRAPYRLTGAGRDLWGAVYALMLWGDEHHADRGRRVFLHHDDDGSVDGSGRCAACGADVPVQDLVIAPSAGLEPHPQDDPITVALREPHRLLTPLRPAA